MRLSEQLGRNATEVARELGIHPGQIYNWRTQFNKLSKRQFSSRKRDQLSSQLGRDIAVNRPGTGMFVSHQKECGASGGVRLTRGDNAVFAIEPA